MVVEPNVFSTYLLYLVRLPTFKYDPFAIKGEFYSTLVQFNQALCPFYGLQNPTFQRHNN